MDQPHRKQLRISVPWDLTKGCSELEVLAVTSTVEVVILSEDKLWVLFEASWRGSWEMVDWCWILYWDSLVTCRIAPEADVSQNMSVWKMTLLPTFSHGLVSAESVGGSWATSNPELATMCFTTSMESCWLEWSKSEEFCNYCSITWASAENNCIQKNEDLMYYEP